MLYIYAGPVADDYIADGQIAGSRRAAAGRPGLPAHAGCQGSLAVGEAHS